MNRIMILLLTIISCSAFAQEEQVTEPTNVDSGQIERFLTEGGDTNTVDVQNFNLTYPGGICRVNLVRNDGSLIERFESRDCNIAYNSCQRELRNRHSRGMNPYARCVYANNGGGYPGNPRPNRGWICVAKDGGWEEHYGGHSGYAYNRWNAEQKALNECRRFHSSCYISQCDIR